MSTPVRLVDSADGPPRTTPSLVASLAARLGTLFAVSGADAIGSLASGVAKVGREVADTADGRRARDAIEAGIAGHNGDALWRALKIDDWVSQLPASPVLDHLRNDYSLLLAEDLDATLDATPAASQSSDDSDTVPEERATFADFLIGLWFISGEVRTMLDDLIAANREEGPMITSGPEHTAGRVLR